MNATLDAAEEILRWNTRPNLTAVPGSAPERPLATEPADFQQLLASYRALKMRVEAEVAARFPYGVTVCPPSCPKPHWYGTTGVRFRKDEQYIDGDKVWVDWRCGNRYFTPVDEILIVQEK